MSDRKLGLRTRAAILKDEFKYAREDRKQQRAFRRRLEDAKRLKYAQQHLAELAIQAPDVPELKDRYKEYWSGVGEQLRGTEGKLVLVTHFGSSKKRAEEIVSSLDVPKDTPIDFSVHVTEDRHMGDDYTISSFNSSADAIRDAFTDAGFTRVSRHTGMQLDTLTGLGIDGIKKEFDAYKPPSAERHLHFAVVSALEVPEVGINYRHANDGGAFILESLDGPNGAPVWQELAPRQR